MKPYKMPVRSMKGFCLNVVGCFFYSDRLMTVHPIIPVFDNISLNFVL